MPPRASRTSPTPRAPLTPNPPDWVADVIVGAYDAIAQTVPVAWLPKIDELRRGRSAILAKVQEYGCGAYGCVFPTLDPHVVLKVTSDETEAQFAAQIAGTLSRPICVRYHAAVSVPVKHKGSHVHLLWRDSADHVGKIGDVLWAQDGTGPAALDYIHEQHVDAGSAFLAIHDKAPTDVIRSRIRRWLASLETMAAQDDVPALATLASGMIAVYQTQRVFFGDVHSGNLGLVHRPEGELWVITDPGHVAIVDLPY